MPRWRRISAKRSRMQESGAAGQPKKRRRRWRALGLRHRLQAAEGLEWVETGRDDVLRFRRPNGWEVVTNFGERPFELAGVEPVIRSGAALAGAVAGESTVWLAPGGDGGDGGDGGAVR